MTENLSRPYVQPQLPESSYSVRLGSKIAALAKAIIVSNSPQVEKIYLFGSVATGQAHPLSDIDLCLVCSASAQLAVLEGMLSQTLAHQGFSIVGKNKPPMGIDLKLVHNWDFATPSERGDQEYLWSIRREGVLLYSGF